MHVGFGGRLTVYYGFLQIEIMLSTLIMIHKIQLSSMHILHAINQLYCYYVSIIYPTNTDYYGR